MSMICPASALFFFLVPQCTSLSTLMLGPLHVRPVRLLSAFPPSPPEGAANIFVTNDRDADASYAFRLPCMVFAGSLRRYSSSRFATRDPVSARGHSVVRRRRGPERASGFFRYTPSRQPQALVGAVQYDRLFEARFSSASLPYPPAKNPFLCPSLGIPVRSGLGAELNCKRTASFSRQAGRCPLKIAPRPSQTSIDRGRLTPFGLIGPLP